VKFASFLNAFQKQQDTSSGSIKRDQWTEEIFRLLILTTTIPVGFVLVALISGQIPFAKFYPIVASWFLLVIGWLGIKRNGWRWAGFIPPVVSTLLGIYGAQYLGVNYSTILLFAISVIMAGVLLGDRASILFVFLCTAAFVFIVYDPLVGLSVRFCISVVIVFCSLLILSVMQRYFFSRLEKNIKAQITATRALEEEISRRQQAEDIQHMQESHLKRLTDNMTDLVAEIDLSGKYLYTSPSYYPVLGYQQEELANLNAFELVHPDDLMQVQETIQRYIDANQPGRDTYRVKHADGHYVWVESSWKLIDNGLEGTKTIVLSSHDITLQRQAEENNQDSEKKFRSLIESSPLGIHMYALEEDSRLVFNGYNPSANSILHIDHSKFMGKTIEEAFPDLISTDIPDTYRRVALTGESCIVEQIAYINGRIQGVFEVHAFQISPGNIAAFFADISERTRYLESLRISEEKFSKVFFTSPDTISISRLSDGLFIDVNPGFTKLLGFERDEAIGKTSTDLNVWVNPENRGELIRGLSPDNPTSKLEMVLRAKDGHFINVLMSASKITMDEEQYLLIILRDITERIQAEQKLIHAHTGLEHAYEATLQGWARALDLREHETADHSRRVVEFTVRMTEALGIVEQDLVDVQRGALLHDLGKVGVPDNILLKPGPLTSDEWVIMRQHPLYAYNLLKDIDYLSGALDIPYCHHEHWDGSGYPRGLKGEEIPLTARIFAIVDVWDALLSNRPYRPAWDKQAVLKYIQEQSGKLFDPAIVSLFIRLVTEDDRRD